MRDAHAAVLTEDPRQPLRRSERMRALSRGEWLLWRRNKVALFNSFVMPVLPFLLLIPMRVNGKLDSEQTSLFLAISIAMLLLFVVYYNLLSAYVTRRDELVLKRWRSGECSDVEILASIAGPSVGVSVLLVLLMTLTATFGLGQGLPLNALLLVIGVAGGVVLFAFLALVTTVVTRNAEASQVTSLPLVLISMTGAGFFAADSFPSWLDAVARCTPLAPVVELVRLGWEGRDSAGELHSFVGTLVPAAQPVAVLLAWILVAGWLARDWFRWDPRS